MRKPAARVASARLRRGGLRADDDKVDGVFFAEGDDGLAIQDVDIGAFGEERVARIAGGDDEAVSLGVLLERPGEGMFAPRRCRG